MKPSELEAESRLIHAGGWHCGRRNEVVDAADGDAMKRAAAIEAERKASRWRFLPVRT